MKIGLYKSSVVHGVTFFNQAPTTAKVVAIAGRPEALRHVGHYGFEKFSCAYDGHPCEDQIWAKDVAYARAAANEFFNQPHLAILNEGRRV